jgi:multidrug efflux system membrane fusion protein
MSRVWKIVLLVVAVLVLAVVGLRVIGGGKDKAGAAAGRARAAKIRMPARCR